MRPDLAKASFFDKIAKALGLTEEERIVAWDMMTKSGVDEGDYTSVMFAVLSKVGGLNSRMIDELPQLIKRAVTGDLREAVDDALATLPSDLAAKVDEALKASLDQMATNVDIMAQKEADRRQTFRMTQVAGGCAAIVLVALGSGYFVGRETTTAEALRMEQLMQRPDDASPRNDRQRGRSDRRHLRDPRSRGRQSSGSMSGRNH